MFPARFPVPAGLTPNALREFLEGVLGVCTVVGAQITSAAPGHAAVVAEAIAPLLG
jgi:hypothetical protein